MDTDQLGLHEVLHRRGADLEVLPIEHEGFRFSSWWDERWTRRLMIANLGPGSTDPTDERGARGG